MYANLMLVAVITFNFFVLLSHFLLGYFFESSVEKEANSLFESRIKVATSMVSHNIPSNLDIYDCIDYAYIFGDTIKNLSNGEYSVKLVSGKESKPITRTDALYMCKNFKSLSLMFTKVDS